MSMNDLPDVRVMVEVTMPRQHYDKITSSIDLDGRPIHLDATEMLDSAVDYFSGWDITDVCKYTGTITIRS